LPANYQTLNDIPVPTRNRQVRANTRLLSVAILLRAKGLIERNVWMFAVLMHATLHSRF
jgi:hypothetical protein